MIKSNFLNSNLSGNYCFSIVFISMILMSVRASFGDVVTEINAFQGMPLNIQEDSFKKLQPKAKLFDKRSSQKTYMYKLKGAKYFGFNVIGVIRGFEKGNGCFLGLGLNVMEKKDVSKLLTELKSELTVVKDRIDAVGNVWFFLESDIYVASVFYPLAKENEKRRGATLNISLRSCDSEVAKNRWQTLPRF